MKACSDCCFSNGGHQFAAASNNAIAVYNTYTCELLGTLRCCLPRPAMLRASILMTAGSLLVWVLLSTCREVREHFLTTSHVLSACRCMQAHRATCNRHLSGIAQQLQGVCLDACMYMPEGQVVTWMCGSGPHKGCAKFTELRSPALLCTTGATTARSGAWRGLPMTPTSSAAAQRALSTNGSSEHSSEPVRTSSRCCLILRASSLSV